MAQPYKQKPPEKPRRMASFVNRALALFHGTPPPPPPPDHSRAPQIGGVAFRSIEEREQLFRKSRGEIVNLRIDGWDPAVEAWRRETKKFSQPED